jgi:hypothetical protein
VMVQINFAAYLVQKVVSIVAVGKHPLHRKRYCIPLKVGLFGLLEGDVCAFQASPGA